MIFNLAYRNIWRNRRRTLITAASILFAVFFATLMKSIQVGAWDYMVDQVVNYYFGYAQIHSKGYWKEKTLDKSFIYDDNLKALINDENGIVELVPRIESFALASYGEGSKGTLLIGVDPAKEAELTHLQDRVTQGSYFSSEKSLLVSEGLADYLEIGVNDTLVLVSQGYHGVNAAGKYPISGLVKFGSPELNGQMVFMPLTEAHEFYGTEGHITNLIVQPIDPEKVPEIVRKLNKQLDKEQFEILDYEELMPELIEAKNLDIAGGTIIIGVLYAIIGFGIFGTMLMMIKEREYEFGILKAIGMKSAQINMMVWLEIFFLGVIGCVAGMVVALPLVYYLTVNPIRFTGEIAKAYEKFGVEAVIPATVDPGVFATQAIVVFLMVTIMSAYPLWQVYKMRAVVAMRG